MPIKPRNVPPKKPQLSGFQKLSIFILLAGIVLTRKEIDIVGKIHDFFTLPITDPRVTQMGTGVWVIAGSVLIWGLLTIFLAGMLPSGKSKWAMLLWVTIFGLILGHVIFPFVASICAEL